MKLEGLKLRGFDEDSRKVVEVPLGQDLGDSLKDLFKKMFGKTFAAVQWSAGVPGVDQAVLWQGVAYEGARRFYLHVRYSDGRVW